MKLLSKAKVLNDIQICRYLLFIHGNPKPEENQKLAVDATEILAEL